MNQNHSCCRLHHSPMFFKVITVEISLSNEIYLSTSTPPDDKSQRRIFDVTFLTSWAGADNASDQQGRRPRAQRRLPAPSADRPRHRSTACEADEAVEDPVAVGAQSVVL